jgi:hypothetical protein
MSVLRAEPPKATHHQRRSLQATWHVGILPKMPAFQPFTFNSERFAREITRASQEMLPELAAVDGASVDVAPKIHASALEVVLENARTLRFSQQHSFDDQ